jgi:hypothetical protein
MQHIRVITAEHLLRLDQVIKDPEVSFGRTNATEHKELFTVANLLYGEYDTKIVSIKARVILGVYTDRKGRSSILAFSPRVGKDYRKVLDMVAELQQAVKVPGGLRGPRSLEGKDGLVMPLP